MKNNNTVTFLDEVRVRKQPKITRGRPRDIHVDGKTITIEAFDEIILKCGPGAIYLTKEGKIILKGIEIISRAKNNNKIKGSEVEVN